MGDGAPITAAAKNRSAPLNLLRPCLNEGSAMHIQFFRVISGACAMPELEEIPGYDFDIPPGAAPLERRKIVESRFAELVRQYPNSENVLAFSTTVGEPPGSIVASEIITDNPREPRHLHWLYHPMDEQVDAAIRSCGCP